MNTFEYDLQRANKEESRLCYILEDNGCTNTTLNDSADYETLKGYDFEFEYGDATYTGELKVDYKSDQTGNVAVEYKCNGCPSGIFATKADFLFYKLGDIYYSIIPSTLIRFIKLNWHRLRHVLGGDRNAVELVLIPKNEFVKIAKTVIYD